MTPLHIGTVFPNKQSLQESIATAAITGNFETIVLKSCPTRYTVKCAAPRCTWRLHSSRTHSSSLSFAIKTFTDTHTCSGINHPGNSQATAKWVGARIVNKLREMPDLTPAEIIEDIRAVEGVTIAYHQAWRGREEARKMIQGVEYVTPDPRRKPGRPKKQKVNTEEDGREKRSFRCGRCGGDRHSRRTCGKVIDLCAGEGECGVERCEDPGGSDWMERGTEYK